MRTESGSRKAQEKGPVCEICMWNMVINVRETEKEQWREKCPGSPVLTGCQPPSRAGLNPRQDVEFCLHVLRTAYIHIPWALFVFSRRRAKHEVRGWRAIVELLSRKRSWLTTKIVLFNRFYRRLAGSVTDACSTSRRQRLEACRSRRSSSLLHPFRGPKKHDMVRFVIGNSTEWTRCHPTSDRIRSGWSWSQRSLDLLTWSSPSTFLCPGYL